MKYGKSILHAAVIFTVVTVIGLVPQRVRAQKFPDLVITSATLVDATEGIVSVVISNQPKQLPGGSRSSTLRLIVWEKGMFEKKYVTNVFAKVPKLAPGKSVTIKIKAGVPIIGTRYSLFVDINNEVKEWNENNNRWEGETGKS